MSLVLGIESSCDETAAAVVRGPWRVLSNVIATQHELHAPYAGVVPEIASRAHLERLMPVVGEALREASVPLEKLQAVAVGHRPGLIGSLLVGVSAAKALAWSLDLPLIGIDHVLAHLHAAFLEERGDRRAAGGRAFPAVGLVVSGGHTSLFLIHGPLCIQPLGRTIDDAVGEAFDKVAALLGAGYPGGPALERLAREGRERAHGFPVAELGPDSLDFSFSGLKTAVLYAACGVPRGRGRSQVFPRDASALAAREKADLAASFQRAAVTALVRTLGRALDRHPDARTLVVGGGVSANRSLREAVGRLARDRGLDLRVPAREYCLDNAAMIAALAAHRLAAGDVDDLTLAAAARSGGTGE